MHVFRNNIDQALVLAGETDAPDRSRHHLRTTRRDRVDHELAVRIAGGPEKQTRAEFAAGNDQGVGHVEFSSTALDVLKNSAADGSVMVLTPAVAVALYPH